MNMEYWNNESGLLESKLNDEDSTILDLYTNTWFGNTTVWKKDDIIDELIYGYLENNK
tara:strand:+ start:259 stop:432 length:174 start_codon:yes stop_codon:yes gene_type:complete